MSLKKLSCCDEFLYTCHKWRVSITLDLETSAYFKFALQSYNLSGHIYRLKNITQINIKISYKLMYSNNYTVFHTFRRKFNFYWHLIFWEIEKEFY